MTLLALAPIALHERGGVTVLRVLPGVEQLLDPARTAVVGQQRQPQLRVGIPFVALQQVPEVAEAEPQVGAAIVQLRRGQTGLV